MDTVCMCVGMPRSGTTWIAKMIDSHPDIIYNHEPDSVSPLKNTPIFCEGMNTTHQQEVKSLIGLMPISDEKCLGKRPFFRKNYRNAFFEVGHRLSILASKAFKINSIASQSDYVTSENACLMFKSIESTGRIKLFLDSVPKIKILLIVRCVFGQINSVIKGSSGSEFLDNNYKFSEQELSTLFQVHGHRNKMTFEQILSLSAIEQLAYKWLVTNEKAFEEAQAEPSKVKVISYDELCEQPLAGAKSIFSFFNLSFHQQSHNFIIESTASHDESFYSVNKNPKRAKSAWQKNITDEQVAAINSIIAGSRVAQFVNSTD